MQRQGVTQKRIEDAITNHIDLVLWSMTLVQSFISQLAGPSSTPCNVRRSKT